MPTIRGSIPIYLLRVGTWPKQRMKQHLAFAAAGRDEGIGWKGVSRAQSFFALSVGAEAPTP